MKRTLCILLSLMLAVTGLVGFGVSAGAKSYKVGDIIEFGSYPQTEVKDNATILALNAASSLWQSYGYYVGKTGLFDGQMEPSDIMQYRDVLYDGQLYRGVQILQYRPYSIAYPPTAENGVQDGHGYSIGRVYWFLYEPLKWRVLNPNTGLVLSESVIDSQPYNNYIRQDDDSMCYGDPVQHRYANNYQYSSLRQWLNRDFENTAFSAAEKDAVKVATVGNSAFDSSYNKYASSTTYDQVFLLSYQDMQNTAYGFKADLTAQDPARLAKGTDYALCQGLSNIGSNGCTYWHLRTAGRNSYTRCGVTSRGEVNNSGDTTSTRYGVRPAITLDLTKYALLHAQLSVPENAAVGYKSTVTVTATAAGLPEGFVVALYDGDTQLAKGDNTTVTYKMDRMTASKTLTAKIIDLNGNVQSNADGKLEKQITITVKTGFFDKVKAFFLGLFGLLPKITLNP